MDGQHKIAGKAGSIVLGENTYQLSLWTLGDRAELVAHLVSLRTSPLTVLGEQLDLVDPQYHEGLMRAALREAVRQRDVTDDELREYLSTWEGTAYVLWIMVRQVHPEVDSVAAARTLIEQHYEGRLIEFQGRLDQASGLFSDFTELGNSAGRAEAATAAPAAAASHGRTCIGNCRVSSVGRPERSTV